MFHVELKYLKYRAWYTIGCIRGLGFSKGLRWSNAMFKLAKKENTEARKRVADYVRQTALLVSAEDRDVIYAFADRIERMQFPDP
jgi:hypothetical protein